MINCSSRRDSGPHGVQWRADVAKVQHGIESPPTFIPQAEKTPRQTRVKAAVRSAEPEIAVIQYADQHIREYELIVAIQGDDHVGADLFV